MALTERWTAPKVPGEAGTALNASLQRLERVLGRTPVVYPDRIVSAATTIVDTDEVLLADTTSAGFTITLPDAATYWGRRFRVKKMNAGANNVTLAASGANTIDGAATVVWNTQYMVKTVQAVRTATPATYNWILL